MGRSIDLRRAIDVRRGIDVTRAIGGRPVAKGRAGYVSESAMRTRLLEMRDVQGAST